MGLIRIFLALSVVIWHAGGIYGWHPFNGSACVTLFFIISGFYMALILNEKYLGPGANLIFWKNRFFRLWPAFLIATLLSIPLAPAALPGIVRDGNFFSAAVLLIPNFTMVGYEIYDLLCLGPGGHFMVCPPGNHTAMHSYALVPQAWTLGLEIWFYLMAPFVVRSFGRTSLLLLISIGFFVAARMVGLDEQLKYRTFPPTLLFFMLGVLSYYLMRFMPQQYCAGYKVIGIAFLPVVLFLLAFPSVMTLVLAEPDHNKIFIILFTLFIPAWVMWSNGKNWDRVIGETSYPVYVIHFLVIAIFQRTLGPTEWTAVLAVGGSLAAALAIFILVDRPVDRWRQRAVVGGWRPLAAGNL